MRLPGPRAFAILAALCAASAYVAPSSAFELASFSRSASADIVADANAYNALSTTNAWTCQGSGISVRQCTVGLITNKGTTGQSYRLLKETETAARVRDYALGGVAAKLSSNKADPWTDWTSEKSVGQSVAIIVNVTACLACARSYYNFTVEGQKANILEFNETRIMVIVEY